MSHVPTSFLGELFRVSAAPGVISFAGGLPDATRFDCEGIKSATESVLSEEGEVALQYTTTSGYLPLREYIADRYRTRLGLTAKPEEIQIVNGSQQCLDLVGKILINPGDPVIIERPGYLGAVEAFSFYEPEFLSIPPESGPVSGPDISRLARATEKSEPVLFYGIPNSQNPSGVSWAEERRREVADILDGTGVIFYEDDAFGELFFDGKPRQPVKRWLPDQTIMTGSFSKTIAPGLRCGWIWAPEPVLTEFNRAKQAADLHTNLISQMVLARYLTTHPGDDRIRETAHIYGLRCRIMEEILDDRFPNGISHTHPEGGMFLMVKLPKGIDSMEVFKEGVRGGVAVMPGYPFYVDDGGGDTIRLNFSAAGEDQIGEGMDRLCRVITSLL